MKPTYCCSIRELFVNKHKRLQYRKYVILQSFAKQTLVFHIINGGEIEVGVDVVGNVHAFTNREPSGIVHPLLQYSDVFT